MSRSLARFTSSFPSTSACRTFASSSKSFAAPPEFAAPPDNKMQHFRQILYPADSHLPKSSAPSGAHHPDHLARLQVLIPNPEVHETVERAFKLLQRHKRTTRSFALRQQFKAMESACDELAGITTPLKSGQELKEGESGRYDREIYVKAVKRPDPYLAPKPYGRRISPEQRWKEARIEGLVPRETWVPTETRGKGWNYDWQRPASS